MISKFKTNPLNQLRLFISRTRNFTYRLFLNNELNITGKRESIGKKGGMIYVKQKLE